MADLFDRFFGKGTPRLGGPAVANPRLTDPVGLQLLFDEPFALDAEQVQLACRDYHTEMSEATAELFDVPPKPNARPGDEPSLMGLLAWERHVIKVVGFSAPMPPDAVKACVQPAHIDPRYKQFAYEHKTHLMLYYAGYELDPLEQYVALAAAAGALAYFGASFVLNESARTAIPAAMLHPHEEDAGDMLGALRGFPLPLIYCGLVKMEVEGQSGVWMRVYGAHRFGLPDLAYQASSHDETRFAFELFGNLLSYLRTAGKWFAPGDTLRIADDVYLRMRARTTDEWYLESEGEMLVAERIAPSETNRS